MDSGSRLRRTSGAAAGSEGPLSVHCTCSTYSLSESKDSASFVSEKLPSNGAELLCGASSTRPSV